MNRHATRFAFTLLSLALLACGHKAPPLPPPLKNPATTVDLKIQQRGEELVLTFTYPQTTVGGLPLATLTKIEYWELVKPLPASIPDEDGKAEGEGAAGDETAASAESESASGAMVTAPEAETAEDVEATAEKAANGDQERASTTTAAAEEAADEEQAEEQLPRGAAPLAPVPPPPTKEQIAAVELLEFAATAQIRLELAGEELDAATVGDKIVLRLPLAGRDDDAETVFIYAVKTFGESKQASNWSNLATLVRREPPAAPTEFEVEAEAGGVRISWFNELAERDEEDDAASGVAAPSSANATEGEDEGERSSEVKSFRVYRRDAQARTYPPHIGQVVAEGDEYLDRTAQYGNRYIYSLTAVGLYSPLVESALAGEIEIDYQDRFAPPPPRNVIALAETSRVRLLWDASPAPDLRGYLVFRRSPGEADFSQLNARPIVDLEYNDREVEGATEYEYRVTAIDREGNTSDPSTTVAARTP